MLNLVYVVALIALVVITITTITASIAFIQAKHGIKHLVPHPPPAATVPNEETDANATVSALAGHKSAAASAVTQDALLHPRFVAQPPPGTELTLPVSPTNDSAAAIAIAHRLSIAIVPTRPAGPCLPQLGKYILPEKEARFTVINECVTVSGTVTWTHYFNDDGDANFNIALDPQYKSMLGPGSYSNVFASKYGPPAMHIEVVCQAPVTSKSSMNVGACDGYNGPVFKLPKIGQHVKVTGRYQIEMPEMPGGITELHPVYQIMKSPPPGKLIAVR